LTGHHLHSLDLAASESPPVNSRYRHPGQLARPRRRRRPLSHRRERPRPMTRGWCHRSEHKATPSMTGCAPAHGSTASLSPRPPSG